jgi:formylglycine-generating enzyme required for sulfatase activity
MRRDFEAGRGPVQPGEVIDHCRIEGPLGSGGFGAVFRAFHLALEQPRAFKFLLSRPDASDELRPRFLAEARHTARLAHPHIVVVHNVGEHRGLPFIHMEYLAGASLAARLRAGPPPPAEALRLIDEVLAGLAFAHGRGFVHRDVKPDNVMLTEGGVAKLVDFGLSLNVAEASRLTLDTRRALGTPLYMAPEQWNSTTVGPAADLWSVGAMLYQMLGGRHPFEGHDVREIMARVLLRPHVPLSQVAPQLGKPLSDLVDRLLAKEPGARPAGAEEVRSALRQAASAPEPAPAPTAPASEAGGLVRLDGPGPARFRRSCDGGVMVRLEGGAFRMGADDGDADERPRRVVRLSPFLLDEAPVSRRQYAAFLTLWGSDRDDEGRPLLDAEVAGLRRSGAWWEPESDDDEPVTAVSWYGAAAFARWAGVELPTEAQLEFALAALEEGEGDHLRQLVGVVRFWCADAYDESFYAAAPAADPVNSARRPFVSVRGWSRLSGAGGWSRTRRDFAGPHERALDLGFRCALPCRPGSRGPGGALPG